MISVLMPVYNGSRYLLYSIGSILNQTFTDYEFIIVNDGSTDDSEEIILSFKDERIKYFKCEHKGISKTLNFGLSKSSSDIIARMDADDIAVSTRLEEQLNFLNKNPEYDVVSSWYALFKNKKIRYVIKTAETDFQIKQRLILHSEIVHSGVLYRREIIEKYNGYLTDGVEDYELWLKIKNEAKFYNIPKVLTYVRILNNSSSRYNQSDIRVKQYNIQEQYYKNLESNFDLKNENQLNELKGWREYFYGDKSKAAKYWLMNKAIVFRNFRIIIALVTILLPDKIYQMIRGASIRLKLKYILEYFSYSNNKLRENFHVLVTNLEEDLNIH